jgi:hypothetical protein
MSPPMGASSSTERGGRSSSFERFRGGPSPPTLGRMDPEDDANDERPELAGQAVPGRRRPSAFIAIIVIVVAIALLVVLALLHTSGTFGPGSH